MRRSSGHASYRLTPLYRRLRLETALEPHGDLKLPVQGYFQSELYLTNVLNLAKSFASNAVLLPFMDNLDIGIPNLVGTGSVLRLTESISTETLEVVDHIRRKPEVVLTPARDYSGAKLG